MIAQVNGRTPREYASDLLAAGWSVLPIKGDGTKSPALNSWTQYQSAAPTPAEANRFWLADNIGIGIVHGRVSGNTEAIDIDNGDLFRPFIVEVERCEPGLIDKLSIIRTPREGHGYHLIYKCPTIGSPQKLAQRPDPIPENPQKRKTLIETKGEGGYTVAPGSPGCCHETGGFYEHIDGPALTELATITPEQREVLLRVARSFNEILEEAATTVGKPQGEHHDGLSPGDDFNRRATWEQILEPHGWEHSHDRYWRRPGKINGWSATVGCQSQNGTELFCCFSDNAHPLQGASGRAPCTAYSKFALYAVLNHAGDYSAAARRLRTEGYGDHLPERVHDGGDRYTPYGNQSEQPKPRKIEPLERIPIERLMEDYAVLHEPVVEGWFRLMETVNIIAYPKFGKSWFAYYLAYCIVTGQPVFGRYAVKRGKVLIVDLELHKNLISSRLRTVAREMDLDVNDYRGMIEVVSLRGKWQSMEDLLVSLSDVAPGEFVLIIIDSKYRLGTINGDENSNNHETHLYNNADRLGVMTGAAVLLIHHLTKGDQSGKRVTDLGAGGGAQSRAADTHIALREHEDEGVAVLEGAVRSFAPLKPLAIRWEFPLWRADEWADPAKLAGKQTRNEERTAERDREGTSKIIAALVKAPATAREIRRQTAISKDRCDRLLDKLEADKQITATTIELKGNTCRQYHVVDEQPTT
ncbi:MAG: hypothetical protein C0485_19060 [Pirellula sp.]|nr:hypothetical protein [Pirellula sp.]